MAKALILLSVQIVLVYLVLGTMLPGINAMFLRLASLLGGLR